MVGEQVQEKGQGTASAATASPLSFPLFRSIWIANLVSNLGYLIQSVGAAWLMTMLTPSPRMVALVQTSVTLPIMLLALFAGAVADNFDRRRVMLMAQCLMLTASLILTGLALAGVMTPGLLLAFTFLIGCGTALNGPAWQAAVGDMVPKAVLPAAVAYNSIAFNIARSAGPAIGGAIVAAAGVAVAFFVNCLSYIGLIGVLLRWRTETTGPELPPERIDNAMVSGVRYIAMSPHLVRVMVRAAMFGGTSSAISALMPVVARDLMQGGAIVYGTLLGAFGLGAIGGALISARLRRRISTEAIIGLAAAAVAAGGAVTALSHSLPLAIPALMLAGSGWILAMSTLNVTVQLASPRWVVARAIAMYQMCAFGGMAVGSWLFGMMAAAHGISIALMAASILLVAGIVIGRFFPLPDVDDLNVDPLRRWSEPSISIPLEARSGPVAITLQYEIDPADIPVFLAEMNERRRIRRRDGARRWTLYRDLSDPRLWIERYHVPTWLDYVRHNQRRTHADADNVDRIWELHRGSSAPEVQRMVEVQPGVYTPLPPTGEEELPRPFLTDHP